MATESGRGMRAFSFLDATNLEQPRLVAEKKQEISKRMIKNKKEKKKQRKENVLPEREVEDGDGVWNESVLLFRRVASRLVMIGDTLGSRSPLPS